jgi:hypothetical protein
MPEPVVAVIEHHVIVLSLVVLAALALMGWHQKAVLEPARRKARRKEGIDKLA